MEKKKIAILGSTGSIGTQALEIARANPDKIEIEVLTANNNVKLLVQQAIEFNPAHVIIADESKYIEIKTALAGYDIKVFAGHNSIEYSSCGFRALRYISMSCRRRHGLC